MIPDQVTVYRDRKIAEHCARARYRAMLDLERGEAQAEFRARRIERLVDWSVILLTIGIVAAIW